MNKILTIVGARPQFIKCKPVSDEIRNSFEEVLVHTGQHYDDKMSSNFFDELNIPKPDYNLGIGGNSQIAQLSEMIVGIESIVDKENPDLILVYGDTTSTLAGALSGNKSGVKLAHVEAGLRSFNRAMPEEHNRVLTDHLSDYLFTPSKTADQNLKKENIKNGVYNTGDVMFDAIKAYKNIALDRSSISSDYSLNEKEYYFATLHRPYNVDDVVALKNILDAFSELEYPVVLPVHPRTRKNMIENSIKVGENIVAIEPIGYLDSIALQSNAIKVISDSGGVQKEAYYLNTPCVTLRPETEWTETVEIGANILVKNRIKAEIFNSIRIEQSWQTKDIYGDGTASKKIVEVLKN